MSEEYHVKKITRLEDQLDRAEQKLASVHRQLNTCEARLVASEERTEPRPDADVQRYYVTFGVQYPREPHPRWPLVHHDGWVQIDARNEVKARALALALFDVHWAFIYDEGSFDPSLHPLGRLLYVRDET